MKKLYTTILTMLFVSLYLFANSNTISAQTLHVINTQGMTFSPANITINAGDTVVWNNTSGYHNVNGTQNTFPNNPEDFGNSLGSSWTYTHVFNTAGDYDYQCDPHLPGMVGTITVNAITNTIYDIVSNSLDHTTLKTAIDACSLDGALSSTGTLTLFAPTDAAFNLLPSGTVATLLNNIPQLTSILTHHVVPNTIMSSSLTNNQSATTLLGTDVKVTIVNGNYYIDNAMVTIEDILADNGVVHVLDAVILPPSIYDIVSNSADHTTLKAAIDAAGLENVLSTTSSLTLFAPTDAAFDLLPNGTVATLLNDIPQLTSILTHHVIGDSIVSSVLSNGQIANTLNLTDLTITTTNGVYVDNAMVTTADIITKNGVVHVIDAVLIPSTTAINDNSIIDEDMYLYSVNILGKKVNRNIKNEILFDIHKNGKIVKRYNP
tara:strand:- start:1 stop:1302 length:1302 start_codon:yes stop_codon:yes gene_type:complete